MRNIGIDFAEYERKVIGKRTLASMKQKSWWQKQEQYTDKYKYDYIVALIMHSFSWAFMIMLPIIVISGFKIGMPFVIAFIVPKY